MITIFVVDFKMTKAESAKSFMIYSQKSHSIPCSTFCGLKMLWGQPRSKIRENKFQFLVEKLHVFHRLVLTLREVICADNIQLDNCVVKANISDIIRFILCWGNIQ